LARGRYPSDAFDIEKIAHHNRLLVVIGGPGAGKSTLLRRLAYGLLQDGHLVLRISLRTVALRMRKGDSFDESIVATALDGFAEKDIQPFSLLSSCDYLLADGLDEAGEDRLTIIESLQKWTSSRPALKVVLTTRPIGYNPSWFADWRHYEILPLKQENVNEFVSTIFGLLYPDDANLAKEKYYAFRTEIEKSKIASIAVRNPQLLGFLLSLFDHGQDLDGNRYQLFEKIIDDMREQTRLDKEFTAKVEKSLAKHVIEHLGSLLTHAPTLSENEIEQVIGAALSRQLDVPLLKSKNKVVEALKFWEERGLIERLTIGSVTIFIFIHTAFQEFLAAKYLEHLPDKELNEWLLESYSVPIYRETILLLGATKRLSLVAKTLLRMEDINDPVSTTITLIMGLFAEAESIPTNLFDDTVNHLLVRLTSDIPTIVDETVSALIPIAEIAPELIGPIALSLSNQSNVWTIEAACTLGLIAGDQFVNQETLLSIYLINDEFSGVPNATSFMYKRRDHIQKLIIEGGNYLFKHNPSKLKELAFARYDENFHVSIETLFGFEALLKKILSADEMSKLTKWNWNLNLPGLDKENFDKIYREKWQLVLNGILAALPAYDEHEKIKPDKYFRALSCICSILDIGETPATDFPLLLKAGISDELVEVIRGAILVSQVAPPQLRADTEKLLFLISDKSVDFFEILSAIELKMDVEASWSLVKGHTLDRQRLLQAMRHPAWFVCRFAAMLLFEYKDEPDVKLGMVDILSSASGYSVHIIAQIAQEIWGNQAGNIILERLEANNTDDCAPLVEALGRVSEIPEFFIDRAVVVLRSAMASKEVDFVKAAVSAIEKLNLLDVFETDMRDRYEWWLLKGPQDPEISGVIPENAAKYIFECLNLHHYLDVSDIKEAVNSKRRDVQEPAIRALCVLCMESEEFFKSVLHEIENGTLSIRVIDELEKSHVLFCVLHIDDFLQLLETKNLKVKTKLVQMLGNNAFKGELVERELRTLLESTEIELRVNALRSIRKLSAR